MLLLAGLTPGTATSVIGDDCSTDYIIIPQGGSCPAPDSSTVDRSIVNRQHSNNPASQPQKHNMSSHSLLFFLHLSSLTFSLSPSSSTFLFPSLLLPPHSVLFLKVKIRKSLFRFCGNLLYHTAGTTAGSICTQVQPFMIGKYSEIF